MRISSFQRIHKAAVESCSGSVLDYGQLFSVLQ